MKLLPIFGIEPAKQRPIYALSGLNGGVEAFASTLRDVNREGAAVMGHRPAFPNF